ncbi:hypothetical protein K469DRAFT_696126 [Zopfia rhizophila CBS 207.26]|uniref:Uncharacterized protein n=1 Tax=Zopfia rhizophila CBS 207.26 TaxID=1314779 RepID=A0A6A6DEZ6_9PEZI|nr:hypothetical protein K469DRAFT_696126 [Zopfia rhizophila CBS 207.26]
MTLMIIVLKMGECDIRPSHDEIGNSGHNHSLNNLINDSTEEEEEDGGNDDNDNNDDNNESNNRDGNEDEDKKASSSSSEDDKDDSSNKSHKADGYIERQRLFKSSIRGNTASKRAVQDYAY